MDDALSRLASTGDVVKIWDADSMTLLEQFNPHVGHQVARACWTSNNQHVVSAGSGGDKLAVTSLKSPHAALLELAHGKRQTRVSLSTSSQLVASGGLDRCVHIWDLKTARLLRSLKDHTDEVTCVAFNSNDSLVASGSASGHLALYSLTTNTVCKPFGPGGQQPVRDLAASRLKRSLLASVSDDGSLSLWDANAQKELHAFRGAHKAPGSGVAFSPANELLLVSVGLDKKIVCYDAASKIILLTIRTESPLTSVDFIPDGSGLLAGSAQGQIFRYDLRNNSAPTGVTPAHDTAVTCLRFRCAAPRHKSGKTSSSGVSGPKSSACKLSSGHLSPAPASRSSPHINAGGAGAQVAERDAAGQKGAEPLPATEKFSSVGRNSLDMFSPLRQGIDGRLAQPGGGGSDSAHLNSAGRSSPGLALRSRAEREERRRRSSSARLRLARRRRGSDAPSGRRARAGLFAGRRLFSGGGRGRRERSVQRRPVGRHHRHHPPTAGRAQNDTLWSICKCHKCFEVCHLARRPRDFPFAATETRATRTSSTCRWRWFGSSASSW
ncbi:protein NEDD1 isoform X9 [Phycodurus eques]|uniref:protein NEDD1 isoform X9 n=2 Tax=Phycodurus eques TaxID=693459 RepID=UPI002ACDC67A|nr:protein NEDD1 isoform X9 [Phycodurus eques]